MKKEYSKYARRKKILFLIFGLCRFSCLNLLNANENSKFPFRISMKKENMPAHNFPLLC